MKVNKCLTVYFSPCGGTQKSAEMIADSLTKLMVRPEAGEEFKVETLDLLRTPLTEVMTAKQDCLTVVCVPVYAGRVPGPAVRMLHMLKGLGTPAIAAVVYGNRDYDDALAELSDCLDENGFQVIGAAALLAEHSIFPEVAAGRPDASDREKTEAFVKRCVNCLNALSEGDEPESCECEKTDGAGGGRTVVKGNRPYREPASVPIKPHVSRACNNCGLCADLCPVSAIDKTNCRRFDKELCISCGACIKNCKRHARAFCGPIYSVAAAGFKQKCAQRREPEFFYRESNMG